MKKFTLFALVAVALFVGVVIGAALFSTPDIPQESVTYEPQIVEVPVTVVVIATPSEEVPYVVEPTQATSQLGSLYTVGVGQTFGFVESFLASGPFSDPRTSCDGVTEGLMLEDSGICIPKNPPQKFCVEGSTDFPCDMVITAIMAPFAYEGGYSVGGNPEFKLEYMTLDVYEEYIQPVDKPGVELEAVVIPVSSALKGLMDELGLVQTLSFSINEQ